MELKQYKVKIRNQLLHGLDAQARKEKAIEEGDYVSKGGSIKVPHYKIPKGDFDELLRKMTLHQGPTVSMPSHVTTGHNLNGGSMTDYDSDEEGGSIVPKKIVRKAMKKIKAIEDEAVDSVNGGKVHFMKSMKKFGSDFGTSLRKAGIQEATKTIAQEGVKFAKNNIGSLMSGVETALPVAEEVAPLALMAAGMKKPRRTRQVSQKEANRHALIRKLMQQHGCSLAEASKYIKEKNLAY